MRQRSLSPLHLLLFCACLVATTARARGEDRAADGEDAAPVLTPPELVQYIGADYPPEAFAAGLEAVVVAELDIDETGLVTAVRVVEPAGHGFDEAAEGAMQLFVFAPATRDGEPIPSRVIYRYTFFLEGPDPAPEEEAPPPLPASLAGQVTDMDGDPVAGASVVLTPLFDLEMDIDVEKRDPAEAHSAKADDDTRTVVPSTILTDADGAFASGDLPAGPYQADVIAAGFKAYAASEELAEGEQREVIYRLETEQALYETVVRGRRPPREVTRRELSRREITRIPGTGGDALRSIQNLPGMARATAISGSLLVRGSSPGDTQVFLDSIPMPLLYHFGGLTSVVNSDLLERIDFFPGNFSVRYGGAVGGIVDVTPRAPHTDRFHAYIDADIWDVGALIETPIGEHWSVAVAARRSYIDGVLNAVLPDDGGFEFTTAPRYWDYQAMADYHPDQDDNLRIFLYGSDDELVFVFGDELGENPNLGGGVDLSLSFHTLQARWDHRFDPTITNRANVGLGYENNLGTLGERIMFEQEDLSLYLRDELTLDPGRIFLARLGIDAEIGRASWKFRAPEDFPQEGEQWDPLAANTAYVEDEGSLFYYRPAGYLELELTAIEDLRLIYGLRAEYWARLEEVGLDPRFTARYQLLPGTTLKGGIGLFHQSPDGAMANKSYGNPELKYISAIHYALGVEQRIWGPVEVGLEGFYKDMANLVVPSDRMVERNGELVPEVYRNEGIGRVYGMELLLKHQPTDRFFGWVAYTLMRSERIDYPGEDPRLFDHDQTHILTVVASVVIGRGWEAGLRYRLVTGNPSTPIVGAVHDADSDIYWPVYGETNSRREPTFHQLDLRIDKNLVILDTINVAVYVDVQNVYNHKNVEGYNYSYDYSERAPFYGLPILPSLGLKLEY